MSQTETPGLISKQQVSPFRQHEFLEDKLREKLQNIKCFELYIHFPQSIVRPAAQTFLSNVLHKALQGAYCITKSIHYLSIRASSGRNMWPFCMVGSIRMLYSPCNVSLSIQRSLDDLDVQSVHPEWPWLSVEQRLKACKWSAFVLR